MKTIASDIAAITDLIEMQELAQIKAVSIDQNWDEGSTTYTFSDDSTIKVSGMAFTFD